MFNKTMTALGFVMIAATPALAVDGPFPVGEVDANTYFESMANPNAMKFYPDVAVDIGNAVRARADMAGEDAVRPLDLDVEITALRLNDNPVLTDDGEFNILEGIVTVRDSYANESVRTESIILRAEEMETPYATVSPDNQDFYKAMVYAFADRVIDIADEVTTLPDVGEVRN